MANSGRRLPVIFLLIAIVLSPLSGCGSGGSSGEGGISSGTFPAKILTWSPPSQYTDGTPLDPVTDLDRFEFYVKEDGLFSDTDNEMAAVSATDSGTGQPTTTFDLANLAPFLSQGVTYHVSIRAVASTGLKSNFSPSAMFSF